MLSIHIKLNQEIFTFYLCYVRLMKLKQINKTKPTSYRGMHIPGLSWKSTSLINWNVLEGMQAYLWGISTVLLGHSCLLASGAGVWARQFLTETLGSHSLLLISITILLHLIWKNPFWASVCPLSTLPKDPQAKSRKLFVSPKCTQSTEWIKEEFKAWNLERTGSMEPNNQCYSKKDVAVRYFLKNVCFAFSFLSTVHEFMDITSYIKNASTLFLLYMNF